jgi:hypothetical protein
LEKGKYKVILNCGKTIFTKSGIFITGRNEEIILFEIKPPQKFGRFTLSSLRTLKYPFVSNK